MKRIIMMTALALTALGCKHKDYEEPSIESPVFSISGLRNGEAFNLAAGQDGLVQKSDLGRNKFGIIEWSSTFESTSCSDCNPVFSLTMHDRQGAGINECGDFYLFQQKQIEFATSPSTSLFNECIPEIAGLESIDEVSFTSPGSVPSEQNHLTFPESGIFEVEASFELEDESTELENEVTLRQTLYAGDHYRLSAPFQYEVLSDAPGESQQLLLHFPELNGLQATRWEINGTTIIDSNPTVNIPYNQEYEIEVFFTHTETGLEGSYFVQFDNGFPFNTICDKDEPFIDAPSINFIWIIHSPNFEKAFMTYRYNGKTFTSATPLNNDSNSFISILGYSPYDQSINGKNTVKLNCNFSVYMVEVGNESNILELTDCTATFGFVNEQ
ncbi:MAG: hypothetical protein RL040_670 [Bacteroidota bacterium]